VIHLLDTRSIVSSQHIGLLRVVERSQESLRLILLVVESGCRIDCELNFCEYSLAQVI
jgi:hypothetical protein